MLKENGKVVKCPECGSTNVKKEVMFDFLKRCCNKKCPVFVENGVYNNFTTDQHN